MNFQKCFLPLLMLLAVSACKPRETLSPEPLEKESLEKESLEKESLEKEPLEKDSATIPGYSTDLISIELDQINWGVSADITRLDTSYSGVALSFGWFALVADNDSLMVSVDTPESVIYKQEFIKLWNEKYEVWQVYNGIIIDAMNSQAEGQVTLRFKSKLNGKESIREKKYTISELKTYSDVFRLKFGMSIQEVKASEVGRLFTYFHPDSGWNEALADSLYYTTYVYNKNYLSLLTVPGGRNPAVYYEFEKGKLAAVSEIVHPEAQNIKNKEQFESLKKLFNRLGSEKLPFEQEPPYRYTDEPLTWTKNGLKMTFKKRPFKLTNGGNMEAYALTIRLAED